MLVPSVSIASIHASRSPIQEGGVCERRAILPSSISVLQRIMLYLTSLPSELTVLSQDISARATPPMRRDKVNRSASARTHSKGLLCLRYNSLGVTLSACLPMVPHPYAKEPNNTMHQCRLRFLCTVPITNWIPYRNILQAPAHSPLLVATTIGNGTLSISRRTSPKAFHLRK